MVLRDGFVPRLYVVGSVCDHPGDIRRMVAQTAAGYVGRSECKGMLDLAKRSSNPMIIRSISCLLATKRRLIRSPTRYQYDDPVLVGHFPQWATT